MISLSWDSVGDCDDNAKILNRFYVEDNDLYLKLKLLRYILLQY